VSGRREPPAPEAGEAPLYEPRELVYLGVLRVIAAPIFAGLNAIAGAPFSPVLIAVIVLAAPYGLLTIWLGSRHAHDFDQRWLIPADLIVIGAAVIAGEGPDSQAVVIFYLWCIGMALVHPPRTVVICTVSAVVAASLASVPAIVEDPGLGEQLFLVDMIILWIGIVTWCVADVFRRRALDIQALSATRRRLLADALGAEMRARRRLSDSLQHDALQVLLSAGQDLDAGLNGGHPWIASRSRERIRIAVRALRETVRTLYPGAVAEAGLAAKIDAVVENAAAACRTTADVRVDPAVAGVNDALVISLARELSQDAARNAEGGEIAVVVGRADGVLEIAASGNRADPRDVRAELERGSSPLAPSRERVEAAGGSMRVGSTAEGATRVVARLPASGQRGGRVRATRPYGQRELRYFAVARLAAMPLFSVLNAVAGTPVDVDFTLAVILSLVYGFALLWLAMSRYWAVIDARWFAAADLLCLGLAITVTGGPESQLRAAFFVWPVALSMLFPPRIVMWFAFGAMASFAVFSLPEVLSGGEAELRALGTFELSFVWINIMSWFVANSFWDRATRIEQLSDLRQRLLAEALDADDRARRRLSQSLHDDALQVLLAAGQDLDVGLRGDRTMLERAREDLRLAVHRLQDVIRGLNPSAVEYGGLAGGIDAVVEEWATRGGFVADVRVDPAASSEHDALLVSIVRELVSNAAKHADASEFSVELARDGDELVLVVSDDGRGMDGERPATAVREGHIGLASCRERVEVAGGRLELASDRGSGTRITITIPDAAPPADPAPHPSQRTPEVVTA
jgi:two-component system, NarL family, sensor kinase